MNQRVQLNLSITLEQKLALMALAEGHGTSVTKLVLGLIEVPEAAAVVVEKIPEVIKSPEEVPAAVERAAPSRSFTPFTKEQQTGRVKKQAKVVAVPACRHGLLRCKVCGTW